MPQDNPYARYRQPAQEGVVFTDPNAAIERARQQEADARAEAQLEISRGNAAVTAANSQRAAADSALARDERLQDMSQEAQERARGEAAQATGVQDSLYNIRGVIAAARQARAMGATGDGIGSWEGSEGFQDSMVLSMLGANSAALDMEGLVNTIASNTAFDRLQAMREASPTGGALGAVSERELALLRDTIASLSQRQSPAQFTANLDRVIAAYERVAAKLQTGSAYYRENGTMDGFVPPTEEEIASIIARGDGGGDGATAAGAGATETRQDIPQEMQDRHAAYLRENWGNLTPDGYARFRTELDREYNFEPNASAYAEAASNLNAAAELGASPDGLTIPAVNVELGAGWQRLNDVSSNPGGTGLASFANSMTFGIPNALTDGAKMEMMREMNPVASFAGDMVGGTAGTLLTGGGLGLGTRLLGATGRGAEFAANPLVADTLYGAVYGGMEEGWSGAALGAGGAVGGDLLGRAVGRGVTNLRAPADPLNSGERAIVNSGADMDEVAAALMEADQLGVPMMPADAVPELQAMAGSATRYSPTQGGVARDVIGRRGEAQGDRLLAAIERDLGPVDNIPQRSEDLIAQARLQAAPLYEAAYAAPGADDLDLGDLVNRPTFASAMREAFNEVRDEGLDPAVMGFVETADGNITIPGIGGQYVDARGAAPPSARSMFSEQSAPPDLVSFVRQRGGMRDTGGEMAARDLNNRPRRGVPLAGNDTRAGPVVNESGMTFDEMAEAAWEAGYFGDPTVTPRPSEREFLDAFDDTWHGTDRRFSIEDEQFAQEYMQRQEDRVTWDGMEGLVDDISQPAGPDAPFAPPEAYGEMQEIAPTWQTLDYIKRGLDNIVERETDAINGVSPAGRRAVMMRNDLVGRMDAANPDYAAARAAYAGPARERAMLREGQDAYRANPEQLGVDLGRRSPQQTEQMRLGYQSAAANRAGDLRNNSNPWAQLNTPNSERRLEALYGTAEDADVAQLLAQRDMELQLAGSGNRLTGNSLTAERGVADELFNAKSGMGGDLMQGMAETAISGAPWITVGRRVGDRFMRDRGEARTALANTAMADEIGALLLNDVPPEAVNALSDVYERNSAHQEIVEELLRRHQRVLGPLGAGFGVASTQPDPR